MERVQRSVTFGPAVREKTDASMGAGSRPASKHQASRPKTTGELGAPVGGGGGDATDTADSLFGLPQRRTKTARSVWAINKEQRKRKDELNRQMEKQLRMPVVSGEKMKKMRELRERPVELSDEQREQINSQSFETVISQYKQLRLEEERRMQGLVSGDSINDIAKLKNLSEKVHANIERLKKNSLMDAAKREEKRRMVEQSKRNMLMIYQEEDMSVQQRIEKNRRHRRQKLITRFQICCQKVVGLYNKRLAKMAETIEEKYSAKARLMGKTSSSKKFSNLFEAVVYLGYVEESDETLKLKKTWDEVRKCRYLRGYEPEDVRLPEDEEITDFVFGKKS